MAEVVSGKVLAWVLTSILVALFISSLSMNGTWMGGVGMGSMMIAGAVLLALAVFVAYRFGRLERKVEDLGPKSD